MDQPDLLRRLLDAGMTFTAMTQARAEALIRDLVRAGEVQAEQAQSVVDELVERSRRNSERLIDAVRTEIRAQMSSLGLATTADVERLEQRVRDLQERVDLLAGEAAPATRTAKKATGARKATKAEKATTATKAEKATKAGARTATTPAKKAAKSTRTATKASGPTKKTAKKTTKTTKSSSSTR